MKQILRKIRAKKLQISGNPARSAHKKKCVHSASVRCAYFTASLRVDRVSIAFRSEKESVQRRDHANFAPNSRERIAKSPKNFGAPRAQKLRELGQRGCANRKTSSQLFSESACVLMQDNARVQRRDDANFFFSFFFFARIGRSDLTKKLEKVGPFECDELEKHCRVSAKCYPTKVPALYTMTKEKFKSVLLVLLLVSRQTKSQLLMINKLVPIK